MEKPEYIHNLWEDARQAGGYFGCTFFVLFCRPLRGRFCCKDPSGRPSGGQKWLDLISLRLLKAPDAQIEAQKGAIMAISPSILKRFPRISGAKSIWIEGGPLRASLE